MVKINTALNFAVLIMLIFFIVLVQKNIEKYDKIEKDLEKVIIHCK